MNALRATLFACACVLATACAPKLIPNTQIVDNRDNRDILQLVQKYREAYAARDAEGITALVSDDYLDKRAGISKRVLEEQLAEDFSRVRELQLELTVRRIEVKDDQAQVDYFYSTSYLLDVPDAKWETRTDDKRMHLTRTSEGWRVISGL